MLRLFVGLALPENIAASLLTLQGGIPGARWLSRENLHITLRFIGEVEEHVAAQLDMMFHGLRAPPFSLILRGAGVYQKGKIPHTLWAGVEEAAALIHLREKVDQALQRAGIVLESRKFMPHVTLARLKNAPVDKVGRFLEDHNLFQAGPFAVSAFTLFRSHLTKNGSDYEALERYPLNA